jgi:hypothetical protein
VPAQFNLYRFCRRRTLGSNRPGGAELDLLDTMFMPFSGRMPLSGETDRI